jgi:ribonuclease R
LKPDIASLERVVLEHFAKLPHGRGNFKQLVRELGAHGGAREDLQSALDHLSARGALIESRSGHYVLPQSSREFVVGRLNVHREGYGFLIAVPPVPGVQGDVYIPRESAETAMHGDQVVVRVGRIEPDGRASGEIVRVLKRAHATVVGEFRVRPKGCFVIPHDDRIQQWIEIPSGMEVPPPAMAQDRVGAREIVVNSPEDLDGLIVNVEIVDFPEEGERGVGRVIEILGREGDFGVDVEIMIRKHHIPHRFPQPVLDQAKGISGSLTEDDLRNRRDFRNMDIVTIDGETARDFDDAVWVETLPNGNYALQVHIADVSHYVRPGSPIDEEAHLRGTSVYFPDRAVPMLPVELSTDICSLKPGVDRLVLSALLELDRRGDVVAQEFTRGVIRSAERMTYTAVHALLEGDAALRERYSRLVPRFELMRELALVLKKKRFRRGSIDFDMPEPLIEFDAFGEMTAVTRSPRNIAHRLIEEFMLAANEAVAAHIEHLGLPMIYRIHEKPDPKRVMEFEEVAAQFGYSLGAGAIPVQRHAIKDRQRDGRKIRQEVVIAGESTVTSRNYQKLIERIEGKPEERILSYLMLRSLKQARYSADNRGHFALAAESYTHFTSPIRRYPDLIVHRILAEVLPACAVAPKFNAPTPAAPSAPAPTAHDQTAHAPTPRIPRTFVNSSEPRASASGIAEPELRIIADECSTTERRAAEAERELVESKKAKFMEARVGEEFQALIISTTRFGCFVELESLFIEGLVPIEFLPGDRYLYHEKIRKIIGQRTRRQFSIGDKVTVRLDRVDVMERKLTFAVVEEQVQRKKKKKKP